MGSHLTWCNQLDEMTWMRIKLDRVMGNTNWFDKFKAVATFHEHGISDHTVSTVTLVESSQCRVPFCFWTLAYGYEYMDKRYKWKPDVPDNTKTKAAEASTEGLE